MDAPQTPIDPREALLAERTRVLEELRTSEVISPGQMTYGSQAAAASHVFEQQRDLALRDHNQAHLVAINDALARVDAGTYGLCVSCKRPVPAERLEALPWTALCIDCSRTVPRRR
jgi:RNA polymerase-binding transcription factor DksA